jgi:hypothetical protein
MKNLETMKSGDRKEYVNFRPHFQKVVDNPEYQSEVLLCLIYDISDTENFDQNCRLLAFVVSDEAELIKG